MTRTPFTGKGMTWTYGGVQVEGLKKVDLTEDDGPDAEQVDITDSAVDVYTYMADPMGAKGANATTVNVSTWASMSSFGDGKGSALEPDADATGVFDMAAGTANANTYTNTALRLTGRTTEIAWEEFATQDLTFEGNSLGTWTAPA